MQEHACPRCSEKTATEQTRVMHHCAGRGYDFDFYVSPFPYADEPAQAVRDLKFHGWEQHAEHLAYYLYQALQEQGFPPYDVIAYVPMQRKKQRRRGFNQAQKLAKFLSRQSRRPVTDTLNKVKDTLEQHTLNEKERRTNLWGAFAVSDSSEVEGKTVLLVDDVFTTGSTANECASVLKDAGALSVIVATVCHVSKQQASPEQAVPEQAESGQMEPVG